MRDLHVRSTLLEKRGRDLSSSFLTTSFYSQLVPDLRNDLLNFFCVTTPGFLSATLLAYAAKFFYIHDTCILEGAIKEVWDSKHLSL